MNKVLAQAVWRAKIASKEPPPLQIVPAERSVIVQPEPPPLIPPTIAAIVQATAEEFRMPVIYILGDRRSPYIVLARHVAMYLARELTTHDVTAIGRYIGRRDHSTAGHGIRKIVQLIEVDDCIREQIRRIKAVLIP